MTLHCQFEISSLNVPIKLFLPTNLSCSCAIFVDVQTVQSNEFKNSALIKLVLHEYKQIINDRA